MRGLIDIYHGKHARDLPLYSVAIAARITRLARAKVRTWVLGKPHETHRGLRRSPPLIRCADPTRELLSFTNLIELQLLSRRYLHRIDRDERGIARRLFPVTRADDEGGPCLVVIDPTRRFGQPVLAKASVETATIAERFLAGDSMSALADDFDVDEVSIQEAIRFEYALRRAA